MFSSDIILPPVDQFDGLFSPGQNKNAPPPEIPGMKRRLHGSTLLAAALPTAAQVLCNGRARPGYPRRLGSGTAGAHIGRLQLTRPSLHTAVPFLLRLGHFDICQFITAPSDCQGDFCCQFIPAGRQKLTKYEQFAIIKLPSFVDGQKCALLHNRQLAHRIPGDFDRREVGL